MIWFEIVDIKTSSHCRNIKSLMFVFGGLRVWGVLSWGIFICVDRHNKIPCSDKCNSNKHIPSFIATFWPWTRWCHALSTAVVIYPSALCLPCTPTELSLKLENPVPQETPTHNMWSEVAWSSLKSRQDPLKRTHSTDCSFRVRLISTRMSKGKCLDTRASWTDMRWETSHRVAVHSQAARVPPNCTIGKHNRFNICGGRIPANEKLRGMKPTLSTSRGQHERWTATFSGHLMQLLKYFEPFTSHVDPRKRDASLEISDV